MEQFEAVVAELEDGKLPSSSDNVTIYETSFEQHEGSNIIMAKSGTEKYLVVAGEGALFNELDGESVGNGKVCALTRHNSKVINQFFDYTKPQAFGTEIATMGLGDRLGIASPGHIETVKGRKVKPILAQQSIRELTLLNRTMTDILDAATFAVFQEGYKDGYGADADHIKLEKDIEYALGLGFSFLTLDCSEQIRNDIEGATPDDIHKEFASLPVDRKEYYKNHYLNKTFKI